MRFIRAVSASVFVVGLGVGCSGSESSNAAGTGGVSTGGISTGGVSTGGVSSSGANTGGVSTGGVSTGGVSAGGVTAGGAPGAAGGKAGSTGGVTSTGGEGSATGGVLGATGGAGGGEIPTEKFSFFVASIGALRELSKNQAGFGGDLRFGETTGIAGADKICRTIAGMSMPGAENKEWRAFLSTVAGGPDGGPVHAIDRIGAGPWYDRLGRLIAETKADLLFDRPRGANAEIVDDLPNELGVPNHLDGAPGCSDDCPDNHDVLTGTGPDGLLHSTNPWSTCFDWTNASSEQPMAAGSGGGAGMTGNPTGTGGRGGGGRPRGGNGPWCGHSWPRMGSGVNWMSALPEGGCAPGVNLEDGGGPEQGVYTVGTGGGYGAIYCFALTP